MLKLVKRHGQQNWYIRGTVRGKRIEESTGTDSKEHAEALRVKRELELLNESVHGKRAVATFAQAVVLYLEQGGEARHLSKPLDWLENTPLSRIDNDLVWRGAREVYPRAKPATLNRQWYTPISAVLHTAAQFGWCDKPVLRRPKQPEGRVRWLTKEEAHRLISESALHLQPLLMFMFYTGARVGEALWLDWRYVDLENRRVQFINTKNGSSRGVPLHRELAVRLVSLPHRDGVVFRTAQGKPYTRPANGEDADTSAGTRIKTAFRTACKAAGILDFRPHDCRHTWATWHYQANRDLTALQKLGGWKTLSMVLRYAHTNPDEHAEGIDRL